MSDERGVFVRSCDRAGHGFAPRIKQICVVPRQDYLFLMEHGAAAVFGPGTDVMDAGRTVLDLLEERLRNA